MKLFTIYVSKRSLKINPTKRIFNYRQQGYVINPIARIGLIKISTWSSTFLKNYCEKANEIT